MKLQNRKLREKSTRFREINRNNRKLREKLQLPARPSFGVKAADVINSDISGWERTIRLNRASSDGIEEGQPILTIQKDTWILRGMIVSVNNNYSTAILSSDPRFKIGVFLTSQPNRQFVAQGWGMKGLRVENVPPFLGVKKGDAVFTAPSSHLAPSDLYVGNIAETKRNHPASEGEEKNFRVKPPPLNRNLSPFWIVVGND